MPEQVIQQRVRGFICVNAHPAGCDQAVADQITHVRSQRPAGLAGPRRALVIGASTGYGLATRIALAWGFDAKTLGVFYEKEPSGKRTATAGYYNAAALQARARAEGLWTHSINGDAFSDDVKGEAAAIIRRELGQIDLLIYSLASPRRSNPRTGETHLSALKPIGASYSGKSIDLATKQVGEVSVEPATDEEIASTVGVMGGEDWRWWVDELAGQGLLAAGFRTLAYSYIGPELTYPIYREGTIGAAKKDLERTAHDLNAKLAGELGGGAWVAVNKAVVTQASAAIPVVPLYMSLLFKVMKAKGLHEGTIEQMRRLCFEHLAAGAAPRTDESGLIRLDDLEMRPDVQAEVMELWPRVTTGNLDELSDFAGFRSDFNRLFGFDVAGVDYAAPVETEVPL